MNDSPPITVLGIDGGLAHLGWAVAEVRPGGVRPKIVAAGCIETVKNAIGTAAADNVRRAREVAAQLNDVIARYSPRQIAAEHMSHPRDARAAAMLSMSWGVIAALAEAAGLEVVGKSPMALKRALTGEQVAKKDLMIATVRELYPEVVFPKRKDLHEHVADAVAAIHAFYGVSA